MRALPIHVGIVAALVAACVALYMTDASASTTAAPKAQTYLNLTAKQWHARAVIRTKERNRVRGEARMLTRHIRQMRRAIVHRPSSLEAIRLASITYGQSYTDLVRVADCESPGLSPTLTNTQPVWNGEHATGLFQFLPSTFRSTPYRSENIFSPYANALAAGWMWDNGRRREWACQ